MSGQTRRLAKDSLTSYLRFAVAIVVQLLLVPVVIRGVGAEGYGLWTLTFAILGFLGLVDLGFTTGVIRFTAEARGTGDLDRRNRALSTLMVVYGVLILVALLAVGILTPFYGSLFEIPADRRGQATTLLWILAARSIVVSLPMGIFRSILFGDGRISMVNAIQTAGSLLYGGAAWAALDAGYGLEGLAWANLGAFLLEHLGYLWAAFRKVPGLRISWRLADRGLFKEAASLSVAQFIVAVSSLVLLRTDPILIKVFLPLSAVAVYGVALKVAENMLLLLKQGVNVLGPLAAELKGAGREDRLRMIIVSGSKLAFAPAVGLTIGAMALGEEGLLYWVGPEFVEAYPVLVLLMTAMSLSVPQMVASSVFTMTGLHRLTAWAALAGMVVNLGLSLALVRSMGLVGVALSTLIAASLVDVFVVFGMARRHYGIRYGESLLRVFLPVLVPGAIAFGVLMLLKSWMPPGNVGEVLLLGGIGFGLHSLLFLLAGLDRQERDMLKGLFKRGPSQPHSGGE